jgi:hypothetical protein
MACEEIMADSMSLPVSIGIEHLATSCWLQTRNRASVVLSCTSSHLPWFTLLQHQPSHWAKEAPAMMWHYAPTLCVRCHSRPSSHHTAAAGCRASWRSPHEAGGWSSTPGGAGQQHAMPSLHAQFCTATDVRNAGKSQYTYSPGCSSFWTHPCSGSQKTGKQTLNMP